MRILSVSELTNDDSPSSEEGESLLGFTEVEVVIDSKEWVLQPSEGSE